jgi:hypothetical protein
LTERSKVGVLLPNDTDEKTGNSVIEVLESKHPDARISDFSKLKKYPTTPEFAEAHITEEVLKTAAQRCSSFENICVL